MWAQYWLSKREEESSYVNILEELPLQDFGKFKKYLGMNTDTFKSNESYFKKF